MSGSSFYSFSPVIFQFLQIEQPFGKFHRDEFLFLVYSYDKFLLGGNEQFLFFRSFNHEKGVYRSGIYIYDLSQKSVMDVFHLETDKEVPG